MTTTHTVSIIVSQALSHVKACISILQLRLSLDPYIPDSHPASQLPRQLAPILRKSEKLVHDRKIAPTLLNCNAVGNAWVFGSSLVGLHDDYVLAKALESSQEWANESLRCLNEEGLEEKEVRQTLIEFRNRLEECSQELRKLTADSFHHRIVDWVV